MRGFHKRNSGICVLLGGPGASKKSDFIVVVIRCSYSDSPQSLLSGTRPLLCGEVFIGRWFSSLCEQ